MAPSDPNTLVPDITLAALREVSLVVDAEGVVLFALPEVAPWRGPEDRPLQGTPLFDLVAPGDRAALRSWWDAFVRTDARSSPETSVSMGAARLSFTAQAWRLPDADRFLVICRPPDPTRERLETLYSVLLTMSGTLDLDTLLDYLLEQSRRLIPADSVMLFLVGPDEGVQLIRCIGADLPDYTPEEVASFSGFATTRTVRATGRPLLIQDTAQHPMWTDVRGTDSIRSWIGAPLIHRGQFLGVLNLNANEPGRFTNEDAELAQALASQAAAALYTARTLEEDQRRIRQLAAIGDVSQALGHLDLNGLLEVVYQKVNNLMDATTFYIALYNQETQQVQLTGAYEHGIRRSDTVQAASEGLVGIVLRTGKPIIISDTAREKLPEDTIVDGEIPRSILLMPLATQDDIVGAISVQSYRPNAYTDDDIRVLETVSGPIASAIQNLQLFHETASRLAMLEAIHRLGLALASGHDADGIARLVLVAANDLFAPREARLYLIEDAAWESTTWIGERSAASDELAVTRLTRTPPGSLIERSLRTSQPEIQAPGTEPGSAEQDRRGWPVRAAAACPIRYGDRLVGALALYYDQPYEFLSDRLRALDLVCMQAAAAFENARYHLILRRRLDEVSALHELAQRVSSSQALDDMLRTVTETIKHVFGCRSASVSLLDEQEQVVQVRAAAGVDPALLPQARFKLGEPVAGRVVATSRTIYVADTRSERGFRFIDPDIRALLCVPLTVQDRTIGALSIDSDQPYAFSTDHERLLVIAGGQIAAALETMRLLDETRRHAAELAEANANLKALDELRDELIANVSHELRSPLALVRGYAGLLRAEEMGPVNEEQASVLAIIDEKAQSISRLIEDILTLGRISPDTLELGIVELNELCATAVEGAALVNSLRQLNFETELVPGTYMMEGDRDRLNQVLDNLLGNAAKFSPPNSTIRLRTSVDPSGTRFQIAITDQGIGIPASKLPHIFERFYQADRSIKHQYGGAGLGLSIVKRIVEAHGGTVYAESQENQGSTFIVELPLEPS